MGLLCAPALQRAFRRAARKRCVSALDDLASRAGALSPLVTLTHETHETREEAGHGEAMAAPPINDRLREATEGAVKRGVFGVPTFFVGDDMF